MLHFSTLCTPHSGHWLLWYTLHTLLSLHWDTLCTLVHWHRLCTLHYALYTLHSALCTLHFGTDSALCTLGHTAHCTLHSALYTLDSAFWYTLCTLGTGTHSALWHTLWTLIQTLHSDTVLWYTLCTLQSALGHTALCTLHTLHTHTAQPALWTHNSGTLYTMHSGLRTPYCALCSLQSGTHSALCTLHSGTHSALCTLGHTLDSALSALWAPALDTGKWSLCSSVPECTECCVFQSIEYSAQSAESRVQST